MKKVLFFILAMASLQLGFSQSKATNKKSKQLGIQFTGHDFTTPAEIKSKGMSFVLADKQWTNLNRQRVGMAITYTEGLNEHFDFNARIGMSDVEYTLTNKPFTPSSGSKIYFELDANIFMKLLTDNHIVVPFLSLGAGATAWDGYYAAYMPAGLGLQFNIFNETFFVVQGQYRMPVTANVANNLFFSIGFSALINK